MEDEGAGDLETMVRVQVSHGTELYCVRVLRINTMGKLAYPMPKAPLVTIATLPSRSWISFLGPTIVWSTDCIVLMIRWVKNSRSGLIEFQIFEEEKENSN